MADNNKYSASNALQRFRERYGMPKSGGTGWRRTSEFTQYLEDRRKQRGEQPLDNTVISPGQRLYYNPNIRYATTDKGVPLYFSAATNRFTTQNTGIPGVYQGIPNIDVDDTPGVSIFATSPRTQLEQAKVGDPLFYHRDGQRHWYDTNPQGGTPLFSSDPAATPGGLDAYSLQGQQPAVYRPPASTQTPLENLFGGLQEYRPGQEIIHPNPNPTSLVVKDAHGNDIILPVGAAANDMAGQLGYAIDAATSGVTRGLMSQAGARTGLNDLFKAAGSAISGTFNQARKWAAHAVNLANPTANRGLEVAKMGQTFASLTPVQKEAAIAKEVIRRTVKTESLPTAIGNWLGNLVNDEQNLIPVYKGTLEEVGDDKFQATIDKNEVEWLTWDEYMTKKSADSFAQAAAYFQDFNDEHRPDTVVEAEKLGWKKPDAEGTPVDQQGAIAYANQVENSAAAFIAKRAQEVDAQAWAARGRGDYAEGQRLRVEAIRLTRMSGGTGMQDPYFAYSWIENRDNEARFLDTVAAMEMQLGRPLTEIEVWRARDQFVNPYTEFAGDAAFDWTNLAGGMLEEPVRKLLKPLGSMATQAIKQANIPVVTPLVRYFGERSVRSAAGRFGHGAFEVFMGVAHSVGGEGTEGFLKRLDEVGRAVANGLPAQGDVGKLLNLPAEFGGRQERILLGLGNAFSSNPQLAGKGLLSTDWSALGEAAYKEVYQQAYDAAEKLAAKQGLVDEAAMAFARSRADEIANDPTKLVPVMASKFREGYLQAFAVKPSRFQQGVDKAMGLWTAAVLSSRPAWMFRNWTDNMFRYMVFGGSNPLDNLDLLVGRLGNMPEIMAKLDKMGVNPTELTETFARSTLEQGGETVAQRVRMGWRPKTFLEYFSEAHKQAWKTADVKVGDDLLTRADSRAEFLLQPTLKGGLFQSWLSLKSGWNTLTGGITDWNAAVETAFKLRMFDQQFQANMVRLSEYGKKRVMQQLKQAGASERVQGVMGKVWDQYYTDPESLRRMVADLRVGNTSTFQVVSQLVPDNLDEMLGMLEPSARAEFTRTIVENMKVAMETARLNGQKFNSDAFFDDLLSDFQKQKADLLNQLDTRDAPDPNLAGKQVAGEVDLTPSNGAVPQAAEASAFIEVKKSVPEAVASLKNARNPKAMTSAVRDAVGNRWNVVERQVVVDGPSRKQFVESLTKTLPDAKQRQAVLTITDAIAQNWAKVTGNNTADWYDTFALRQGGEMGDALLQKAPETSAFKNWFQSSKVVDADGKPLVVYHGTPKGGFEEFSWKPGRNQQLGFGAHFSEDRTLSEGYASGQYTRTKKGKGQVYEVYLSIQKPLDATQIVKEGSPEYALAEKIMGKDKWRRFTSRDEDGLRSGYLQKALDGSDPKRVERILREAGYDGVKYEAIVTEGAGQHTRKVQSATSWVVFDKTQIKSVANRGTFDPTNPNILQQGAKGGVEWMENGKAVIHAFQGADVSTIVHETAHVWLPQLPTEDAAVISKWLKSEYQLELPDGWHLTKNTEYREAKETFARGFERYLAEGKAPTPKLKPVFERFKGWLTDIYKSITGSDIDIRLNNEVRGVFDRWVAEAPAGSKPYFVTVENGKVTLAVSPDVAKMKGKEARAVLREAVGEAVAKEKGFDAADVKKFLDNPAALKAEKPDTFQQLSDFFDNEPDLRKTLAGLQGKDRLDYHAHAAYPNEDVKVVMEEGGIKTEVSQGYKNPEVNIRGKAYQTASAKINDAVAAAPGTPKSIYLATTYQQVDLVKSRLRTWALNVYPGPLAVAKEMRAPLWDMWEDMLYKIYDGGERMFSQIVDSTANLSDEMVKDMPQQSLSQILGQFGYTFQFKKDGSLRRIVYHPNNPKLKYHPPTRTYSMEQFIKSMFGGKAVNGPDMQRLIMQEAYTRELAQGVFPEVSEVTSEVVEQAVRQIDDEVVEMTADFRATVKNTLGIELDDTGTKKLAERRVDNELRAVLDKVERDEPLTAAEAKVMRDRAYVQATGLPNKGYYNAVVKGSKKELPYKVAIDLDFLKWFNDTGGHPLGDELLKAYAEELEKAAGKGNAFHFSGDEYLAQFPDEETANRVMAEVEQAFGARTFVFKEMKDGKETGNAISASGITFGWGGGADEKSADLVLTQRKQAKRTTRGAEPGGVTRTPQGEGLGSQPAQGGTGQAGREYVDLTEAERAQIEALRSAPVTQPTAGRKLPRVVKEKVEADLGIKLTPDGTKKIEVVETTVIDPDDPGNFEVRRDTVEEDLTPAEQQKVTEQLQRQQAIYAARTKLYQPVNKIKDPNSRALVQNEAQEMMLDVFAIDGFEGKPLSAAEFKEQLRQYSWATKLVDKLPDDNPRRALVEALMRVVSGEGEGDELADGLRKLVAYNLENGVSNGGTPTRLAHPYVRLQMYHDDLEALNKQWLEGLKRDPMQEMDALKASQENSQALWEAYIQQPWVNNKSISQAWGQFARDPQLLAAHLRDTIANLPDGVSDETLEGLQMFLWQVQNFQTVRNNLAEKLGLLRSARDAASTYIPLSKTVTQLPDNFASFFARVGDGAAQLTGFEETLKSWKGHAKAAADLPEQQLGADEIAQLSDLADDAAKLKQNLVNLAAYGEEPRLYDQISDTLGIEVNKKLTKKRVDGKWVDLDQKELDTITRLQNNLAEQQSIAKAVGGIGEGALEKTNRYMIDYGSTTRVDEWAKKAIPFWTFSSRSFPFWLETLGTHPAILAHYQKYIALNRRVQVQNGIQTTRGDQLPSLEGYVPIPGTDLWFNPTAALSFRYIIPNFRTYQDEYEDQPVMAQVFTYLYENSNALGVGLAPYLTIPAQSMGWLEGKPTNAIVPQINLMPPWWINSMRAKLNEFAGPEAVKIFNTGFGADAPWQDFMVERRLLANALARMQANPTQAKAIAAEIKNALQNREQTKLWNDTYNEIKNGDYNSAMLGYFTGIYAKDFTDAEVDFLRMRDEVYALRGQVNDYIGAELFDREASATERYNQYTDKLYKTPEGYTANVYNMLRYVTTDDGTTPNPAERRDLISKSLDQDANVQAYYQAMSDASNRYQAELAALPIGADSELRQAAYKKYMAEREQIKSDFPGLLPSWTIGYKPQEMVFENFEDEFWKAVNATKPRRDANESYEDWLERVAQWEADIPTIMATKADLWLPILAKELNLEPEQLQRHTLVDLPGGRTLDIPALTQEMLGRATVEGYTDWKKRKDSALDALDAGWTAMYYNKYWEYLKGKSGYDRDIAEREFLARRPKPTTQELIAWVEQEYPGRWTPEQLKTWIEGRKMETIESRQAPKDENEQMAQEVWDILAWAGPNKKKLQNEFENLGGYWSSVNMWWESGGRPEAWKDPEDFKKVYDLLKQAAKKLNLTDPDRATLQEWTQAQKLDKQLKSLYAKELGADYLDILGEYWNADSRTRRQLRKQYPVIDQYYDLREAWIEQNPVWAKYYTEQETTDKKTTGSGGGSGGGGTYRRRGGGGGGGGSGGYPQSAFTVGLGGRSTMDANMLPGTLGKGPVSRGVRIPLSVKQLLGDTAAKLIEAGEADQATADYVQKIAARHPEHQETWAQIMASMEGKA